MFKFPFGFILLGLTQEILWICVLSLGPLREHTEPFLALVLLAFILCVWTYFRLPIRSRQAIWIVLGFAFLFRFTLLFAPPDQGEDVYRYIWDARVASMGINPYAFPPNAPELEKVRDNIVYPLINSKPYITAYPPLSQLLFRANYEVFGANVTAMKAMFSLFEFLAGIITWRLLAFWGQSVQPLELAAWNPFFHFRVLPFGPFRQPHDAADNALYIPACPSPKIIGSARLPVRIYGLLDRRLLPFLSRVLFSSGL